MQGYVFDILNALDGAFAKHGALINKKYPPCPVCGRVLSFAVRPVQ